MNPALKKLFAQNRKWSQSIKNKDPEFFEKLSHQQNPKYLWIGCSDSRVPANQIIGLMPGEVFVHRNIANMVIHTDLNCLSVIQYAVEILNVEHIIVCGHYGCGGVKAAMESKEHGLIDNWLRHIKDVYRFNQDMFKEVKNPEDRIDMMCRLNVIEQVRNLCGTSIIQKRWKEKKNLSVHGVIYSLKDGLLQDLNVSISSMSEAKRKKII
ncbi:carbonate dehydratase [Melioribacter sp. OK-6-Me]|uniref:carbonate dehydratase n=1 Tax=unclassified Melioribacter TaxID=2627329 RepID=UPI003ED9DA57